MIDKAPPAFLGSGKNPAKRRPPDVLGADGKTSTITATTAATIRAPAVHPATAISLLDKVLKLHLPMVLLLRMGRRRRLDRPIQPFGRRGETTGDEAGQAGAFAVRRTRWRGLSVMGQARQRDVADRVLPRHDEFAHVVTEDQRQLVGVADDRHLGTAGEGVGAAFPYQGR